MEKYCNGCEALLISGSNWTKSREKRNVRACSACEASRAKEFRTKNSTYYKDWTNANQARVLWLAAKKRAAIEGVAFNLTIEDIVIPTECPVLGIRLIRNQGRGGGDTSPTLDRFVPADGYVLGNVEVISFLANRIKSNATFEQIKAVADWMASKAKSGGAVDTPPPSS